MNSTPTMSDDDVTAIHDEEHPLRKRPLRRLRDLRWTMGHPDGIVTGLSAEIAERLSLDPLWVRLAFIGSALFGGFGAFVYAGLWLALIVARSTAMRVAGAAVVIVSFLVIAQSDVGFSTGPVAVMALFAGLALALWKPVPTWAESRVEDEAEGDVREEREPTEEAGEGVVASRSDRPTRIRPTVVRRPRSQQRAVRPPSTLGRSTLGLALIVAAVGALIDELNNGRLHPEQWLGAAAIVCGLGLLIGTLRGHARWLVLPAFAFAVAGYGGGVLARIGVQPSDVFSDSYSWTGEGSSGPYRAYTGFGAAHVQATEVRSSPVIVDVRTAAGLNLTWDRDVTVEIRSQLGDVTMRRNGNETTGTNLRLGPDGPPDVVIDLRMARGNIEVLEVTDVSMYPDRSVDPDGSTGDPELVTIVPPDRGDAGVRPDGTPIGPIVDVEPGIAVTTDGWIILNGDIIIDQFNNVMLGDWYSPDEQSILINSEIGEYRIVGPVIFTPDGSYYDIDALRQQAVAPISVPEASSTADYVVTDDGLDVPPSTVVSSTVVPSTVVPITVPAPNTTAPNTTAQDTNGIDG